jgi:hypothetical protein
MGAKDDENNYGTEVLKVVTPPHVTSVNKKYTIIIAAVGFMALLCGVFLLLKDSVFMNETTTEQQGTSQTQTESIEDGSIEELQREIDSYMDRDELLDEEEWEYLETLIHKMRQENTSTVRIQE